jgi:hypothetical protein
LAEPLGEPLAYQARRDVGGAASGSGNNVRTGRDA